MPFVDRNDPDQPHPRQPAVRLGRQTSRCRPGPRRSGVPRGSRPSTTSTAAGNHQLDHTLHIITITRAQTRPSRPGIPQHARKQKSKTKKGALHCLRAQPRAPLLQPARRTSPRTRTTRGADHRARATRRPPASPPAAGEDPADRCRPLPDGLHQLDRSRPRPAPGRSAARSPATVTITDDFASRGSARILRARAHQQTPADASPARLLPSTTRPTDPRRRPPVPAPPAPFRVSTTRCRNTRIATDA